MVSLQHQPRFILLVIISFWFIGPKCLADNSLDPTCSTSESGLYRGSITVVYCRVRRICQLQDLIASKKQVIALDLSSNSLKNITEGSLSLFTGVRYLSLAYNDIQVTYRAFYGLGNLTTLNLSKNPLQTFSGNLSGLFPSLSTLDATGLVDWKPEKKIFHLRMLQRIIGLTWSAECTNCLFYRNDNKTQMANYFTRRFCHTNEVTVDKSSLLFQLLNETQFEFRCQNQKRCLRHNYVRSLIYYNFCWDGILVAMKCQSFLGGLSVVFNFVTFLNIIASRRLRNNVCMLLVCNMAFSDFLTGIYTIAITVYMNAVTFLESHHCGPYHCWKIGMFWMLGQASSVVASFYLTLERYLVFVYSLQPEVRITHRLSVMLIFFCWLLAVLLTGIALYYNFFRFSFHCIPILPDVLHTRIFAFTLFIVTTALVLYGISFGFYVHIYFTVQRAAQDAGVRRESKLAKRIALLVFSNVFFFVLPVLIVGLFSVLDKNLHAAGSSDTIKKIFLDCFPLLCLSLNSCINPVMHAFRNDNFREVLKTKVTGLLTRIRSSTNRVTPAALARGNEQGPSQEPDVHPSHAQFLIRRLNRLFIGKGSSSNRVSPATFARGHEQGPSQEPDVHPSHAQFLIRRLNGLFIGKGSSSNHVSPATLARGHEQGPSQEPDSSPEPLPVSH